MPAQKRNRGAQRRSKKRHQRHLEQKAKAKNERKKRKKYSRQLGRKIRKAWGYVWKIIVSIPALHRFWQFVISLFKDA